MTRDQARARQAEEEARRMFQRALASWASDLLTLRRKGLDRPCARVSGRGWTVRRAA